MVVLSCVGAGVWCRGPSSRVDRQAVNPRVTPGQEETEKADLPGSRRRAGGLPRLQPCLCVYSRCNSTLARSPVSPCSMGSQVRPLRQPCGTREAGRRWGSQPGLASWGLSSLVCTPRRCWGDRLRGQPQGTVGSISPFQKRSLNTGSFVPRLFSCRGGRPGSSLHKTSFSPSWRHPSLQRLTVSLLILN